jgi:hypothetical protein
MKGSICTEIVVVIPNCSSIYCKSVVTLKILCMKLIDNVKNEVSKEGRKKGVHITSKFIPCSFASIIDVDVHSLRNQILLHCIQSSWSGRWHHIRV